MRARLLVLLSMLLVSLSVSGCFRGWPSSRPPIHPIPNMDYQPKGQPLEASDFFYDGMVMRRPVQGTVARGELEENLELVTGRDAAGAYVVSSPASASDATLERGADRFTIYCQPCHDKRGTGRGIMLEYGKVPTPSLHDEQRRGYTDGQLYDIITNGSGLMPSYRYPIPVDDRWAIVAYVRRLQEDRLAVEAARR